MQCRRASERLADMCAVRGAHLRHGRVDGLADHDVVIAGDHLVVVVRVAVRVVGGGVGRRHVARVGHHRLPVAAR